MPHPRGQVRVCIAMWQYARLRLCVDTAVYCGVCGCMGLSVGVCACAYVCACLTAYVRFICGERKTRALYNRVTLCCCRSVVLAYMFIGMIVLPRSTTKYVQICQVALLD